MTEILNKEFSRKAFVKGGGALIVGFSVAGAGARRRRPRRRPRTIQRTRLDPGPLDHDADRLRGSVIHADNTATMYRAARSSSDRERRRHC